MINASSTTNVRTYHATQPNTPSAQNKIADRRSERLILARTLRPRGQVVRWECSWGAVRLRQIRRRLGASLHSADNREVTGHQPGPKGPGYRIDLTSTSRGKEAWRVGDNIYGCLLSHWSRATKGRGEFIHPGIEPVLFSYINTKCGQLGIKVFALNGLQDHVHLACSFPPSVTISNAMMKVSGRLVSFYQYRSRQPWRIPGMAARIRPIYLFPQRPADGGPLC